MDTRAGDFVTNVIALTRAVASRPVGTGTCLGRQDAPAACRRSTAFADRIVVEPSHAFPRAFLAAAWTAMGGAYDTLAARHSTPEADRRDYRLAAVERYRRSHEIWENLKARGLVSPVDTGLVTASARDLAHAQRLVMDDDK